MFDSKRNRKCRRALVVVQVAIVLPVLIGFTALALDVGYISSSRAEMRAAVDASALAGASGAPESHALAQSRALSTATENRLAGSMLVAHEIHVQVGYWNANGNTFSPQALTDVHAPNSARVTGRRNGIPLYFGAIMSTQEVNIAKQATAIYGGGICAGIWGLQGVDGDGSLTTDSYSSTAGAYGPNNSALNGDICSNQDVVLEGEVSIGGDVMWGSGYDLTIYGNAYTINGVPSEQDQSVSVPPIDMVGAQFTNDNATIGLTDGHGRDPFGGTQWDLTNVTGHDTLTINGGTYYLTSASLAGQAQITVTAPTTFYISGPAAFAGGGLINATADPNNLTIYSTGPTLTIQGSAGFYGSIVAPNTTVTLTGGSDFYGAIMAGFLQVAGDAQVHVDSDVVSALFGVDPEAPVLVQ